MKNNICSFVLATIMAKFLDTLSSREDKEYYLKQGFTYKIDIDASLLALASNQRRDQTFDQDSSEEVISTISKTLNEVGLLDILKKVTQIFRILE